LSAYFAENATFMARLSEKPPESLLWVSAISIGEVAASDLNPNRDSQVVRRFNRFIREHFLVGRINSCLPIDENSRQEYADIINRLRANYPPTNPRQKTELHLVQHAGVDINDVWIFATALKHQLTLLTTDKMTKIRTAIPEVRVENWLISAASANVP